MKQPQFIRDADTLDKWLERFNPLRGATLGTLSTYFDDADEGRYAHVAWFARKMIRRDETIRACMRRIGATITKLKWSVKIMATLPEGITKEQASAQQKALQRRYEKIENLKAAYAFMAKADFWGFAHLERHYGPDGQVTRLEPVPAWHWVRSGLYGAWQYNAKASPWPREAIEIEPEHYVIRELDDPWIEIACIHGLRKNQGDRDWDGYMARYGIPNTFFIGPPGATDDDVQDYNAVAAEMAADGTGVLPHGSDVKTHESRQGGEVFEKKISRHDSAIVLAATGGLLTMLAESGSGTLAGGAHSDTWRELVAGMAGEVAEEFQDQLDKAWLAEDFPGQPVAVYFDLSFPEEKQDRKAVVADVATLKGAGYTPKREWVEEETGVPLEEAEPPTDKADPQKKPLKNRAFEGGPTSARDRAEALQLAENALADVLDVTAEMFRPLGPDIEQLIALAEDDSATADDFLQVAQRVEALLPELVTPATVAAVAESLEAAMGSAAFLGARANIRKRAKSWAKA